MNHNIKPYVSGIPINYSETPYSTAYKGLWSQQVDKDGDIREIVTYIPDDYFPYHKGAIVLVPSGMTAAEFVNNSAWVSFAEANSVCLVVIPAQGTWKDPDTEIEFIGKAFGQAFHTVGVISYDQKYVIGYGDSATLAARLLLNHSQMFAGAALFGPEDLTAEEVAGAYDLHRLPVWILGGETPVLTEYLKQRNRCIDEGLSNEWARVYNENLLLLDESHNTQACSRVWLTDIQDAASLYQDLTWTTRCYNEFLIKRYHHDHLSTTQLKVNFTLEEMGIKTYTKRMEHTAFEGLQERVWSVYVPTDYDPAKAYPMVVVSHGFECTHEYMAKNTEFWKIAEQRKFIAVFTQGLPNDGSNYSLPRWRSNGYGISDFIRRDTMSDYMGEIAYFRTLVEDVRSHYNVDPARIYCTGHSNGSMMTYALSMEMGDVFAASAQVGGPVRQFLTEEDMPADHYRMPAIEICCERDIFTDMEDKNGPLYWELAWRKKENGVPEGAEPMVVDNGIMITYIWNNADGIPVVKYGYYRDSSHSYHSDIAYRVWDEFLCAYTKDEDGNRYYGGRLIR